MDLREWCYLLVGFPFSITLGVIVGLVFRYIAATFGVVVGVLVLPLFIILFVGSAFLATFCVVEAIL